VPVLALVTPFPHVLLGSHSTALCVCQVCYRKETEQFKNRNKPKIHFMRHSFELGREMICKQISKRAVYQVIKEQEAGNGGWGAAG
jgi:hypothetical protein